MSDVVFITGNQHKADYLAQWLGVPPQYQRVDLNEIQSLDIRAVAEDKARRAYQTVRKPVLVEDVAVSFEAFGALPGTYIKWFLAELGSEKLCRVLDGQPTRKATARICFCYYDGQSPVFFEGAMCGEIADTPRGTNGFGWDDIFIKEGMQKTRAELSDIEQEQTSMRHQVHIELREFLQKLEIQ